YRAVPLFELPDRYFVAAPRDDRELSAAVVNGGQRAATVRPRTLKDVLKPARPHALTPRQVVDPVRNALRRARFPRAERRVRPCVRRAVPAPSTRVRCGRIFVRRKDSGCGRRAAIQMPNASRLGDLVTSEFGDCPPQPQMILTDPVEGHPRGPERNGRRGAAPDPEAAVR